MDKETLSNYGWIVICVLVLAVMLALASPFGSFIADAVKSTTAGLFDVNQEALGAAGIDIADNQFADAEGGAVDDGLPADTDTMIYRTSSLDPNITYTDFTITKDNRAQIGYTDEITNLIIPVAFQNEDGTWYKVTTIGQVAFQYCTSLTSITIPDSVTSIEYMAFYRCTALTSIIIPDSVTSIGNTAFFGCSITTITIPDSVTSIEYNAFYGCTALTSITIPDSVTSIGSYAFYNCSKLTSVTIPDSVTTIGDYAFKGCDNLTSITFENPNGWWHANTADSTNGTVVDLPDPTTAATYLTSTYDHQYWRKSEEPEVPEVPEEPEVPETPDYPSEIDPNIPSVISFNKTYSAIIEGTEYSCTFYEDGSVKTQINETTETSPTGTFWYSGIYICSGDTIVAIANESGTEIDIDGLILTLVE